MKPLDALVVGAGMAGLSAARMMQGRLESLVLIDKARRPGGRMATREWLQRGKTARCDHGAQFFTTRSPALAERVRVWMQSGVAAEWCRGFGDGDGNPRYIGQSGMNAVPQALARGLDIRCRWQIASLRRAHNHWVATSNDGRTLAAKAAIVTLPAPQTITLLAQSEAALDSSAQDRLRRLAFDPCLAVMAALPTSSQIPPPGGLQPQDESIRWIADNRQKGISPDVTTVTIHGSPSFSRRWIDGDREEGGRRLLQAARAWIGSDIEDIMIHGWRYSMPRQIDDEPALTVCIDPLLIVCGDAFNGPRVEGAFLSGQAAAEKVVATV